MSNFVNHKSKRKQKGVVDHEETELVWDHHELELVWVVERILIWVVAFDGEEAAKTHFRSVNRYNGKYPGDEKAEYS